MTNLPRIDHIRDRRAAFEQARAAGMTGEQAGRWVAYLQMKADKGEQPITLEQAVAQLRVVARSRTAAVAAVASATSEVAWTVGE